MTQIFRHIGAALLLLFLALPGLAADAVMPPPGDRDKCPVCGMFVKPYPEWTAAVVYRDGHAHYFDGAKDLFKFLQAPGKYGPHQPENVTGIFVTEYYDLAAIEARAAVFVVGSDVLGPMGRELVPLKTAPDAQEFIRDHGGRMVRFDDITPELIRGLDPSQ